LASIEYSGWLTIEAFGTALPELVAATRIWRKMLETPEGLAGDGITFMRKNVEEYGLLFDE